MVRNLFLKSINFVIMFTLLLTIVNAKNFTFEHISSSCESSGGIDYCGLGDPTTGPNALDQDFSTRSYQYAFDWSNIGTCNCTYVGNNSDSDLPPNEETVFYHYKVLSDALTANDFYFYIYNYTSSSYLLVTSFSTTTSITNYVTLNWTSDFVNSGEYKTKIFTAHNDISEDNSIYIYEVWLTPPMPDITFNSPELNYITSDTDIILNYTASHEDDKTINCSLYGDNSPTPTTLLQTNLSLNGSISNNITYNLTNLDVATYYWKVNCTDGTYTTSETSSFRVDRGDWAYVETTDFDYIQGIDFYEGYFYVIRAYSTSSISIRKLNPDLTYTGTSFDITASPYSYYDLTIKNDIAYVTLNVNDMVKQFNITTGAYITFKALDGILGVACGITHTDNNFYVSGDDGYISKYDLDLEYISRKRPYIATSGYPRLEWDDPFIWITDRTTDRVYAYYENLTFAGINESISPPSGNPAGITYNGKYRYISDSTNDQIYTFLHDTCSADYPTAWTIDYGDFCILNETRDSQGNLTISNGTLVIQDSGNLTVSGNYVFINPSSELNILSGGILSG